MFMVRLGDMVLYDKFIINVSYELIALLRSVMACNYEYTGQGIQEWTKQNWWKTAFKKFGVIWSA